jgi:signal transduction histidine kinase
LPSTPVLAIGDPMGHDARRSRIGGTTLGGLAVHTQDVHDEMPTRHRARPGAAAAVAEVRVTGRLPRPAAVPPPQPPPLPAPSLPAQPGPVGADPRAVAALAVLSGEDVSDVAERLGMPLSRVMRYAETFRAAGIAAVTGVAAEEEQAVDRYLGMLAHEMRAPISAVYGWVELLGTERLAEDEQEPARQLVFARLDRLKRLCDDLLDATALRLGRLRLSRKSLDFTAIVTDVARSFADSRVVVHATGPASVQGDPDRLDQVVSNLLTNALRHGAPGPVEVLVRPVGGHVEMAVRNAGPLRGPVQAERIFDAYEKGCGAGHGLGLYVTRAIVLAHGGNIEVHGSPDVTEFVLRLPVEGPPPGAFDVPAIR